VYINSTASTEKLDSYSTRQLDTQAPAVSLDSLDTATRQELDRLDRLDRQGLDSASTAPRQSTRQRLDSASTEPRQLDSSVTARARNE